VRFLCRGRGGAPSVAHDFLEWHRERVAVLTNLTTRELPDSPISHAKLAGLPLLVPSAGLLADFLSRWYGPTTAGSSTGI
jgi:hypothetical protein